MASTTSPIVYALVPVWPVNVLSTVTAVELPTVKPVTVPVVAGCALGTDAPTRQCHLRTPRQSR